MKRWAKNNNDRRVKRNRKVKMKATRTANNLKKRRRKMTFEERQRRRWRRLGYVRKPHIGLDYSLNS